MDKDAEVKYLPSFHIHSQDKIRGTLLTFDSVYFVSSFAVQKRVLLTYYCSGDQIEKDKMGGACGKLRREERCIQGFGGET